jgi:hypothetical protein
VHRAAHAPKRLPCGPPALAAGADMKPGEPPLTAPVASYRLEERPGPNL